MSRHLCISVTLLDGRFHGLGDDGAPEWPPSPWRLYQALLAGGHAGCRAARWTEAQSAAMRWLAKLDPPRILAPAARTAQAYTLWVPNNDHDIIWRAYAKHRQPKKSPADLRTAKPTRPTLLLDPPDSTSTKTDTVYWLYPLDDWPDNSSERSENVTELQRIASGIHSLGWGVDAAIASVSIINGDDALPGQVWEPAPLGVVTDRMLRTPAPDALIELSRCHESFMCRLEGGVYKPTERPGERA
ncbi:MAG: type I-U CRISPR-associated protein Cas5/Cas6, partial [Planctomycetes bacterium]|nr:type I-U CRISPR-associated protein Cas5/Cas6 [Planctomycetota bacterium]